MKNKYFLSGDINTGFIGDQFVLETGEDNEELRDVAIITAALQMGRKSRQTVASSVSSGGKSDAWRMMSRRSRWVT